MQLTFDFYWSKGSRREQVHCCAANSSIITVLKFWLHPLFLGATMTGVQGLLFSPLRSSIRPSLLLIVSSAPNIHCWLRPHFGLDIHTLLVPSFTSSTNLGKKIPHFKFFLVLGNVNQFALSHWFSYYLHECMNGCINCSLFVRL